MVGRYLYKYVAFDNEMKVMDIIDKNLIMFSPPSRFNDPFDCNPRFVGSKNPKKDRPDLFEAVGKSGFSPAKKIVACEQAVNRMSKGLNDGSLLESILATSGVVSLSRTPWSILMWSHYAEKHTGFLVEIKQRSTFGEGEAGGRIAGLLHFR